MLCIILLLNCFQSGDSSQDEGEEEAKAVTLKFARPESDAAKARRLASYGHMKKLQDEEEWIPLRYNNTMVYKT